MRRRRTRASLDGRARSRRQGRQPGDTGAERSHEPAPSAPSVTTTSGGPQESRISRFLAGANTAAAGSEEARQVRDLLAEVMMPEQVAEAQRRAKACQAAGYQAALCLRWAGPETAADGRPGPGRPRLAEPVHAPRLRRRPPPARRQPPWPPYLAELFEFATVGRPRRSGRGLESAERAAVDRVIAGLLFMGGLRRSEAAAPRLAGLSPTRARATAC